MGPMELWLSKRCYANLELLVAYVKSGTCAHLNIVVCDGLFLSSQHIFSSSKLYVSTVCRHHQAAFTQAKNVHSYMLE
jgi:hypothetical protein